MIYKFKEKEFEQGIYMPTETEMEVFIEDFVYKDNPKCCIKIYNKETDGMQIIFIDKKDVYHLIGALHLIQKEL